MEQFLSKIKSEKYRARFRDLYEQYYVKKRTMKEISKDHGINEARVSQLLAEMRNGIKKILEAQGFKTGHINW